MFNNFPYFIGVEEILLIRSTKQINVPADINNCLQDLLKALQFINTLRTLQIPNQELCLDSSIDKNLRENIASLLNSASSKTNNKDLKNNWLFRAEAFKNNQYSEAALKSSLQSNLPIEVMIGSLPSWRYRKKPKAYSALIAIPDYSDSKTLQELEDYSLQQINCIIHEHLSEIKPSIKPPKQITADVIALSGDFSAHPIHIAHFLPEDEGCYAEICSKTLVYRNLYLSRYEQISRPLSRAFWDNGTNLQPENEKELWVILSLWFKGHDLGHTFFDQFCKKLDGLNRRKRYVVQETMADIFGLLITYNFIKKHQNTLEPFVLSVYLTEMIRYMTRDVELFPDAKAAWFQFGFLLKNDAIVANSGYLVVNFEKALQMFYSLINILFTHIIRNEIDLINNFIDTTVNFEYKTMITNLIKSERQREIDPNFLLADSILLIDKIDTEDQFRSTHSFFEFDGKKRF